MAKNSTLEFKLHRLAYMQVYFRFQNKNLSGETKDKASKQVR